MEELAKADKDKKQEEGKEVVLANKLFKSDSQRVAFLLCFAFSV